MGKLKTLRVVLDKDVFAQGDFIRGHVEMEVASDARNDVKRIQMRFKGFLFQPSVGCTETYFDETLALFQPGQQPKWRETQILPGVNRFPFQWQLPTAVPLPFSFESKIGAVRYRAHAIVSIKNLLTPEDIKTLKHFSVIGPPVNLNVMEDVRTEVTKKIKSRGFGVGPVRHITTVGLPRRGYVAGEAINVIGQVDTRAGQTQKLFKAKLIQRAFSKLYREGRPPLDHHVTICKADASVECRRGQTSDFTVGPLLIPPVAPSHLYGCCPMSVEYYVQIKEPDIDTIKFRVVIGTVPLHGTVPCTPSAPPEAEFVGKEFVGKEFAGKEFAGKEFAGKEFASKDATGKEAFSGTSEGAIASAPPYEETSEAPPPSYEETVGVASQAMDKEALEDHFRSEDHFVPRYPYFNMTGK